MQITGIHPFSELDKFDKINAKAFLELNFAVTSWAGSDTIPLPDIENFELKNTFKAYDPFGFKTRNMCALYYSKLLNMILISFPGTAYTSQWIDDFVFNQINPADITKNKDILVHIEHYNLYNSLRNDLMNFLKTLDINDTTVLISTGHSLGSSLASLCFFDICENQDSTIKNRTLYSFAGPRVGNVEFANTMNKENTIFRVANTSDLATSVPLPITGNCIYSHFDKCITFTKNYGTYTQNHCDSYTIFLN